jgi:hypothetical protein
MENNTALLSDKQIVKAKLNTAADSILPTLLYTCSLHAAYQTCTNKKKNSQLFFTGLSVYLSLVRLSYVSFTCLSSIWNAAALGRGDCWRWSPLSLSPKTHPAWLGLACLGLAWLGFRPFPGSCPLLLSFVRRCLNAGLLCGGMRVLGVWSAHYSANAKTEKNEREEDIYTENPRNAIRTKCNVRARHLFCLITLSWAELSVLIPSP